MAAGLARPTPAPPVHWVGNSRVVLRSGWSGWARAELCCVGADALRFAGCSGFPRFARAFATALG
eukprot:8767966-Prorocentrum_lima.AAC.1